MTFVNRLLRPSVAPPAIKVTHVGARFRSELDGGTNWAPMATAPRDGTVIELRCTYGVAPSYGLYAWDAEWPWWKSVKDPRTGFMVDAETSLKWRPCVGDPAGYVDPTGGAQNDMAYWRGAAAASGGLDPDTFERPDPRGGTTR
jgi:hypothetical protein